METLGKPTFPGLLMFEFTCRWVLKRIESPSLLCFHGYEQKKGHSWVFTIILKRFCRAPYEWHLDGRECVVHSFCARLFCFKLKRLLRSVFHTRRAAAGPQQVHLAHCTTTTAAHTCHSHPEGIRQHMLLLDVNVKRETRVYPQRTKHPVAGCARRCVCT